MSWYRLKNSKISEDYLKKMDMIQMIQCFIDSYNLSGFRFSPHKARPEIQVFIDKYPYLIEKIEQE